MAANAAGSRTGPLDVAGHGPLRWLENCRAPVLGGGMGGSSPSFSWFLLHLFNSYLFFLLGFLLVFIVLYWFFIGFLLVFIGCLLVFHWFLLVLLIFRVVLFWGEGGGRTGALVKHAGCHRAYW